MAAKKIDASFATLGAFWPPNNPNECLVGTLSSRDGRLHYLTAPKYEVLEGADFGQIFMQMGTVRKPDAISCMQGRTEEEHSSLSGVTEMETPGVVDTRSGENLYSTKYRVWAAVLGLRLTGPDTKEIESAIFRFTNVHEWMPRAWGVEFSDHEIAYRIPRKAYEVFSFSSVHLNAEVCCVWGKTPIADRCSQLLCHANETSFADRLRRTYALLPPAFLERYFGAPDDLTRTIVQTRNFFTHLDTSPGALVVRGGKELFLLNQKLTALLRCVILIDLGIPSEYLDQAIAYQSKRWS